MKLREKWKSYLLVVIQFVCIGVLAATGPLIAKHLALRTMEAAGIALGIWAIAIMKVGRFNVTPDVRQGSALIMHGPYRFVRHPMYTSLLLTAISVVLDHPTAVRLVVCLVLVSDLIVKLLFEEKLLAAHFSGYSDYMKRTKRLVPFLF